MEFHMVALASLHLSTIRFKVYLERSFVKKKISLVLKDPITPPHWEGVKESWFSACERSFSPVPHRVDRKIL
ncbi:hypothetical protein MA16_Dca023890 [Dendrobium catenatum]|uniref:Uncharacterized protein n=1 Tax=Dendrobium catenatum TaxID=906689 RepID=A0A2I0WIW1_9ASPA|nr:hypothetical protein MA16_Dca023890 [Dendrobium catenatum]